MYVYKSSGDEHWRISDVEQNEGTKPELEYGNLINYLITFMCGLIGKVAGIDRSFY